MVKIVRHLSGSLCSKIDEDRLKTKGTIDCIGQTIKSFRLKTAYNTFDVRQK